MRRISVCMPAVVLAIAQVLWSNAAAAQQKRSPVRNGPTAGGSGTVITDFAGSPTAVAGTTGDGGPATAATLFSPYGLAFDSAGNLYYSDYYRSVIRRIDGKTGIITRVAGTAPGTLPTCGYTPGPFCGDGGPAMSAALEGPAGIAFDANDNLYIADSNNSAVRRVDAKTQVITTIAGISQCRTGVCFADSGYSGDNGPATAAQLNFPYGVTADGAGDIYIADQGNGVVREIVAGSGDIVTVPITVKSCCTFNPFAVAMDGAGNLIISDSDGDNQIWQYNPTTQKVAALAGVGGTPDVAQFCPQQTDAYGDGCPATQAELINPLGTAYDANGNLYVSDAYFIRVVDAVTGIISVAVGNGTLGFSGNGGLPTAAQVNIPWSLAFDGSGNLYIADTGNKEIREVNFSGTTTLNAFAIADGYNPSVVATAAYVIAASTGTSLASSANPAAKGALVTFTATVKPATGTGTPTGTVAFAVDGKTVSSPAVNAGRATYSTAGLSAGTHTIAAAYSGDSNFGTSSASLKETIAVPVTATPVFTPKPGTYTTVKLVTISDATSGAAIYYTTNGTAPTIHSTRYTKALTVSASVTLKAIAVATGHTASATATGAYTIHLPATIAPTFTPPGGTYKGKQTVKLASKTSGAAIYYTTNGTTPTTASKRYAGPITVSTKETIEAIAIAPGHAKSTVVKASYTIQ